MKHIGNIRYAEGAKKGRKKIGRGQGSGYGGTTTKGHKGQKSRRGASIRAAFEGGQMPLNRRVPKYGFFNRFRIEFQIVNVGTLQELVDNNKLEGDKVDFDILYSLGIINKKSQPLKILGNGEISSALNVSADKISGSAKEKIESAGGTVILNG